MPDYQPVNASDVLPFTKTVGATAVTGGQLVSVSGDNTVIPSTAGDHSIGVAAHDAGIGLRVSVWPLSGVIHESTPQGVVAVAAGVPVIAGTTGFINTAALGVAAAAGTLLGTCTKGGTGGTSKAQWIGS
jgi:hypothetical protein